MIDTNHYSIKMLLGCAPSSRASLVYIVSLFLSAIFLNAQEVFPKGYVLIDKARPLRERLAIMSTQTRVLFPLEFLSEKGSKEVAFSLPSDGTRTSLENVIVSLREIGYKCVPYEDSMLVIGPGVEEIDGNPLDTVADSFPFDGEYEKFVVRILSLLPGYGNTTSSTSDGIDYHVRYEIKMEGRASIRQILMALASKYGVSWRAAIREVHKDGESTEVEGARKTPKEYQVSLSFWQAR